MSRCTSIALWAAARPASTSLATVHASADDSGPLRHPVDQGRPGQSLHHQPQLATLTVTIARVGTGIEDGDDVGMVQPSRRAGLALETKAHAGVDRHP